jgi:hydroxypyruvate isomerase
LWAGQSREEQRLVGNALVLAREVEDVARHVQVADRAERTDGLQQCSA